VSILPDDDLRECLRRSYTHGTTETYLRDITAFCSVVANSATASNNDVLAYLGSLRRRYGASTIQKVLSALCAFYDVLHERGIRPDNPTRSVQLRGRPRKDMQLQDLLSVDDLDLLVKTTDEAPTPLEYRHCVLMGLLVHQALTPAELENLRTTDVDLHSGMITIKASATLNGRELPLKPTQILLLHRYLETERLAIMESPSADNDHLLITSSGRPLTQNDIGKHLHKHYINVFGKRNINPQLIRQSVIANLLRQGHDVRVVKVFAGHKYPSSTERYQQSQVDIHKEAVQDHHPLR